MTAPAAPVVWTVVGTAPSGGVALVDLDAEGRRLGERTRPRTELGDEVVTAPREVRWVWSDTPAWYAALVARGIRVERCHDLRLTHAILRDSTRAVGSDALRTATQWDAAGAEARHWIGNGSLVLRGRTEPTRLYVPR